MPSTSAFRFRTTSWGLVLAAAVKPTPDSRQALAALCEAYWNAVYAFIRRSGYDSDQSQDLTQGFFLVLLEKNYLRSADRERGRFRSFLLTAVKHFLCNERDRAHALKRGGGKVPISIDQNQAEAWYAPAAVDPVTPETLFDRRWALSLIERVSAKQREHYIANGKGEQFEKLSIFLNRNTDDPRYAEMAAATGLSAGALRMSVHRMRRKYRELLRAEIAETVATPEEIDDEIRFLLSTLSA
jgi:RNA polymerase sigma-70 factor (ECF subfamily)